MDCGVPFCQSGDGCPVQNVIPEWNDLVHRGRWAEAAATLHSTNNFPELTGRLCPAPCESACVLSIIDEPVAIRNIEQSIADRAFVEGWVTAKPPVRESQHSVAIVGSGPAGLAAAQQLRRAGHRVVVFERADRIGGLLRYGIPDFKLEKSVLDRRLEQLVAEGVEFRAKVNVGEDISADELRRSFDAICLTIGATRPRDLTLPGRELTGVHFAMEYLTQSNQRRAGDSHAPEQIIDAKDKRVVIIGGGDTGSDCAGTAIRQGATSVVQFELMPQPPVQRSSTTPWPLWPMQLRSSHAHEEGTAREWSIATTRLSGVDGHVRALHTTRVTLERTPDGRFTHAIVPNSESKVPVDLVLLAMGFGGVDESRVVRELALERRYGAIHTVGYKTSVPGIFAAGDARRGASLLVWAIREGRDAAAAIDAYLAASSDLHAAATALAGTAAV